MGNHNRMQRAPACNTSIETAPAEPVSTTVPLTPEDFGIPRKRCYCATELGGYLLSPSTWLREIAAGRLRALPIGEGGAGTKLVPYGELVAYFLRQQRLYSQN